MKRISKAMLAVSFCLLVMFGTTKVIQKFQTQQQLSLLLVSPPQLDEVYEPSKQPARKKRAWLLYNLWKVREERSVASQIVPFLHDEYGFLRENAARMLGRLEDPIGEAPLKELLAEVQKGRNRTNYVHPEVIKLALGRIGARKLKGQTKVNAVAKSVNLTWSEVVQLSQQVRQARSLASNTAGQRITKEIVNVLYEMGNRGEKIESLAQALTLHPAQKILLQSASLSRVKQVQILVNYLAQLDAVTPYDIELAEFYLIAQTPQVNKEVLQKLRQMKNGTARFGETGCAELFQVAALIDERRAIPLLQHFKAASKQPISGYAMEALQRFEATKYIGKWESPQCPTPPLF